MVKGKFQEWQQKYPEVSFELLQHIAGTLNPADLPTRTSCTTQDVEKDMPWQNGPSFLKLPRENWPVSREFKIKIPDEEVIKTIQETVIKVCHLKVSDKSVCSCKVCSLLSAPCECSSCKKAIKLSDSPHFQSLCHIMTRTTKIEKVRGIMARVLRTSATITEVKRPGGYKDFSQEEMDVIMRAPLSADDYQRADRVIVLLMQPQVKSLLDSVPVGKKKAKNSQQGISTLPKEFLDRPIIGPDSSNNLASLSPFKHEGIYYTQGQFGKQLK